MMRSARSFVKVMGAVAMAVQLASPALASQTETASATPPVQIAASTAWTPNAEPDAVQQKVIDQARDLIIAKDYGRAIDLLTKFIKEPRNANVHAARELLGVAYERKGDVGLAKDAYSQYLHDYPNDPGVGRVQQRLAALVAGPAQAAGQPGAAPAAVTKPPQPQTQWDAGASVSVYYYHDQVSTTARDDLNQVAFDYGATTLASELITTLDGSVDVTSSDFQGKLRASGSYTDDFSNGYKHKLRVGELYIEGSDASGTILARFGRQFRSSGGVMGRIDGGVISVRLNDELKVDVIGGFPIDATYFAFSTQRFAYGASVDYASGPYSAQVYTFLQNDSGFVDRQSVGAEGRYLNGTTSAYGTVDYDVHFNQVNLALINGNYVFDDQTSINVAADYRRAPLLRTSDALIGQQIYALSDLLPTYTREEIAQLALDRTAESSSFFVSVGRPLDEMFTASVDLTLWRLSGMPASGGVDVFPSSGTQLYVSGHLVGTGLLMDGDLENLAVGYSSMYNSSQYTLDLDTRYPVLTDLRVGPRIFVSYRDISANNPTLLPGSEITARPTIRATYRLTPDLLFEFEGGGQWQRQILASQTIQTWDYLIDFGVQLDL